MEKISKVIDSVVGNDLCVGCGLCSVVCPSNALKTTFNDNGFIIPEMIDECDLQGECLEVCPTNPFLDITEKDIAKSFLKSNFEDENIGKFNNLFVGFSEKFRKDSSSGGLASHLTFSLLKEKYVDSVIAVKQENSKNFYSVCRTPEEVKSFQKTKYYPNTLDEVFNEILNTDKKYAIIGIACFIKAVRLAQQKNPKLKDKIPYTIGIICGGLKSTRYTDYLISNSEISISEGVSHTDYRKKNINSTAIDYNFEVKNSKGYSSEVNMKLLGDMWGTGLFKAHACDFCEDVTSELADISLGDAWMYPYIQDGKGHNVIVSRTAFFDKLISKEQSLGELVIDKISLDKFKDGQSGAFNHRQKALAYRLSKANHPIQKKYFELGSISFLQKIIQNLREQTRSKSHEYWKKSENLSDFNEKMKPHLKKLKQFTLFSHYLRKIKIK